MAGNKANDGIAKEVVLKAGETTYRPGDVYMDGTLPGVILNIKRNGDMVFYTEPSAAGDVAVIDTSGQVFRFSKLTAAGTDVFASGADVYWNQATHQVAIAAGTSPVLPKIGYAYRAVGQADALVEVVVTKSF